MKIAFDIGGVLGKYPEIFRPLVKALQQSEEIEVIILTDMPSKEIAQDILVPLGYEVPDRIIHLANYKAHEEMCKAVIIKQLGIDILVDDYAPYGAEADCMFLFMWPRPSRPYAYKEPNIHGQQP